MPAAIVLDRMLGGEDSLSFLRSLRENGFRGKVLVVSVMDEPEAALHARADAFLPKPITHGSGPCSVRGRISSTPEASLFHIIRNAIEASEPGAIVRARISKGLMFSKGDLVPAVRISVSDRGSGIGLWLTLNVIHEHNGKLQFRTSTASQVHGTTVSVLLPLLNAS